MACVYARFSAENATFEADWDPIVLMNSVRVSTPLAKSISVVNREELFSSLDDSTTDALTATVKAPI